MRSQTPGRRHAAGSAAVRRTAWAIAACLLALPCTAAPAAAPLIELPSCVEGSPPLRVPARSARATLDDADRAQFERAAQARYAMYRRGGGVPAQVVLIRRDGHWQYLALWAEGPRGLCLAAAFAGERFDFTPAWVARYAPREGDPAD